MRELVIVDAPLLESLIQCVRVIRIIRAPKLRTLAYDDHIPILQLGTRHFEVAALQPLVSKVFPSLNMLPLLTRSYVFLFILISENGGSWTIWCDALCEDFRPAHCS